MSDLSRQRHPAYRFLPKEIEGFDSLAELALDLRWSWNHATDGVWRTLNPLLWELTHNPWVVIQSAACDQIERVLADPVFRKNVDDLLQAKRHETETPAWFQQKHPNTPLTSVAYFSMEFMLSEALPIYSGGLGNVAGDQLKAASDLGVPVTAVGLLYQQGYFRQVIDRNGEQLALYPYNDPGQLPVTPLRQPNGEWLRLEISLPGYSVWLRAWQVQVGRVKLYLLDSNDAANFPAHRELPASCMAEVRSCASSRNCCSGSADGDCSEHSGFNQTFVTSMKDMRRLPCWNVRAPSWRRLDSPLMLHWRRHEWEICSPPIRRWPRALTALLPR